VVVRSPFKKKRVERETQGLDKDKEGEARVPEVKSRDSARIWMLKNYLGGDGEGIGGEDREGERDKDGEGERAEEIRDEVAGVIKEGMGSGRDEDFRGGVEDEGEVGGN